MHHIVGECQKRIAEAASRYKLLQDDIKKKGQVPPEGDGVLIFDEVKVIARLLWNSRSQRMVGLAMTHEDMSCLHDVYQALDPDALTKSTTYMLQFLWRDLTSPFDVVGPYYSSSGSFESKFIVGVVLETVKDFHLFGFQTSLLVCDGASCNLTAINPQWEHPEYLVRILLWLILMKLNLHLSTPLILQNISTG